MKARKGYRHQKREYHGCCAGCGRMALGAWWKRHRALRTCRQWKKEYGFK